MAAGNAARFGENKLSAMVNGKPLIEHALDAIPRESFSRVLVVTQHENVEEAAKSLALQRCEMRIPSAARARRSVSARRHCQSVTRSASWWPTSRF